DGHGNDSRCRQVGGRDCRGQLRTVDEGRRARGSVPLHDGARHEDGSALRPVRHPATAPPATKLVPFTVSVNAGSPAVALRGVSVVTVATGFASSSVIVRTAVVGVPRAAPPVGLLSVTVTVSFPSTSVSLRIG